MKLTIKKFNKKYYEETTITTNNIKKLKNIIKKENEKLKSKNYKIEIHKNYFIDKVTVIILNNTNNLIKIYEIKTEFKHTIKEININEILKNLNYENIKIYEM